MVYEEHASAECPGCENACFRPVIVQRNGDAARAFIVCDLRGDVARVAVEMPE